MRYSLNTTKKKKCCLNRNSKTTNFTLQIEKVRFGSKLNPVFEIDENCLNAEIPNMILQPLVRECNQIRGL
jgi:two-component system, LytTR family, sensor kinase